MLFVEEHSFKSMVALGRRYPTDDVKDVALDASSQISTERRYELFVFLLLWFTFKEY